VGRSFFKTVDRLRILGWMPGPRTNMGKAELLENPADGYFV